MQSLLPIEVDAYLTELVKAGHVDPVLDDMERRAEAADFPIVGRSVGRFLELQARMIGARRVVDLGSGFGYSAYWFARAVAEDGEVVCTDHDPDHARLAEEYLRRAQLWSPVRYHVGDALEGLAAVDGEVDVVFCDIDKDGYPDAWAAAAERLRVGGLFLCDNVLWDGRVAGLRPASRTTGGAQGGGAGANADADAGAVADPPDAVTSADADADAAVIPPRGRADAAADPRDAVTSAVVAMTREVAQDPRYLSTINPVRDGVLVALRVS